MGDFVTRTTTPALYESGAKSRPTTNPPQLPTGWTTANVTEADDLNSLSDALLDVRTAIRGREFNVKHYGAVGDGTTDDTAAIQAAIDAVGSNGGIVFFPAGAYKITSKLTVSTRHTRLLGEAYGGGLDNSAPSRIVATAAITMLEISAPAQGGATVENLGFVGGASVVRGIFINTGNRTLIRNCTVLDITTGIGIQIADGPNEASGTTVIYPAVISCHLRDNLIGIKTMGYAGSVLLEHVAITLASDNARRANSYGVWTTGSGEFVRIRDCAIDNYETGVKLETLGNFVSSRFEKNTTGLDIAAGSNAAFGCAFYGGAALTTTGVHIAAVQNVSLGPNYYDTAVLTTPIDDDSAGADGLAARASILINEPILGRFETSYRSSGADVEVAAHNGNQANSTTAGFVAYGDIRNAKGVLRAGLNSSGGQVVRIGSESAATVQFIYNGTTRISLTSTGLTLGGGTVITQHLSATALLDFADTADGAATDLTITVTGAAVGDSVALGIPNGAITTGASGFYAWVSASNTVTVRFWNASGSNKNPASGTFRVDVWKH